MALWAFRVIKESEFTIRIAASCTHSKIYFFSVQNAYYYHACFFLGNLIGNRVLSAAPTHNFSSWSWLRDRSPFSMSINEWKSNTNEKATDSLMESITLYACKNTTFLIGLRKNPNSQVRPPSRQERFMLSTRSNDRRALSGHECLFCKASSIAPRNAWTYSLSTRCEL